MPIRLKESLPVIEKLKKENIFAMTEERAVHQDIRELKIAILNLMPDKQDTEQQLLRLLSNSPQGSIRATSLRVASILPCTLPRSCSSWSGAPCAINLRNSSALFSDS